MRALMYKVTRKDGTTFNTASYSVAKADGNKTEMFLVDVDERTEKQKQKLKDHAEKYKERFLKAKRN